MTKTKLFALLGSTALISGLAGVYASSALCRGAVEKGIAAHVLTRSVPVEAKEVALLAEIAKRIEIQSPPESRSQICRLVEIKVRGMKESTGKVMDALPMDSEPVYSAGAYMAVAEKDASICSRSP